MLLPRSLLSLIFLLPVPLLAAPEPALHSATLYHHPPFSASPTPLATIAYHPQHPHLSQVLSFSPPKPLSSSQSLDPRDITRIAIPVSGDGKRYRTTAADLQSLSKGEGRFKVVVTEAGDLLGASWRGLVGTGETGNPRKDGKGEFEIVVQREGVRAVIEKLVGKGKVAPKAGDQQGIEGEGEEVEEKTFLQK